MPELPEVASRAREMKKALPGKTITGIDVLQPKCLNVSAAKFKTALSGARIEDVTHHGKWIFTRTTNGYLLLNMGMGGDVLLVSREKLPEKRRVVFTFDDGTALSLHFWWFGYVHYAPEGKLDKHVMSAKLGPNALDVPLEDFCAMLKGRKGAVKTFLLDQENLAGIGNAYVHDILFLARLHPLRAIDTLTDDEIAGLWKAIRDGLLPSLKKGGAWYERSIHGKRGGFVREDILVGYREGKPCPKCRAKIVKMKTGSTATFICPKCQPRKVEKAKKAARGKAAKPRKAARPKAEKPAKTTRPRSRTTDARKKPQARKRRSAGGR